MINIKINKKFKIAIYLIFIVYVLLLINILLFKNGDAFSLLNFIGKKSFLEKISYAQLIPFDTIKNFIFDSPSYLVSIENLFGNIVIFCPMGFLIPLLFKKIHNVESIFIVSFGISLTIELIQLLNRIRFFLMLIKTLNKKGRQSFCQTASAVGDRLKILIKLL
ncbi:VanZ family protein (plasmid) [Clostridium perfringens]